MGIWILMTLFFDYLYNFFMTYTTLYMNIRMSHMHLKWFITARNNSLFNKRHTGLEVTVGISSFILEFQPSFETSLIVTSAFIISFLQTSIHKREVRKSRIIYIILPRAKTCKLLVEQNMYMYMPLMVIC